MNLPATLLLLQIGSSADLLSSRNLGISLWGGLGLLTLALLILMRTRWGQVKPLSKCVVLSVFAHLLLFGYAYGTRLIFDYPAAADSDYIRLAVVAAERDVAIAEAPFDARQPWDRLAFEPASPPDVEAPDRHQVQVEVSASVIQAEAPKFETPPHVEAIPVSQPARPVPEPAQPAVQPNFEPAPSEVAVEEIAAPLTPAVQPTVPDEQMLPRQTISELVEPSPADPQPEIPRELFENDAQLQRLSDLPINVESGDVVADWQDTTAATDNQTDSPTPTASAAAAQAVSSDPAEQREGAGASAIVAATEPATVRRLGDGEPLPVLYRHRLPGTRLRIAEQYGGNAQTEAAVEDALKWLAEVQRADGRWDASEFGAGLETRVAGHDREGAGSDADTGITGLALLAFLGAGHTHFEGTYRKHVQHGLEFLLGSQKADGELAGPARLFAKMYCHGIASLALSEAYAMTGDHRLEPYARRAARYTIRGQHPTLGGWRYRPGDRGDMSQFGWQVMALKSAETAGIAIPGETRAGMLRFLRSAASGRDRGLAGYRAGERPSPTMTAEALACRYFLSTELSPSSRDEAISFMLHEPPAAGRANLYYWYYATLALFQVQGESWRTWNAALQQQLLQRQRRHGELAGSWDADSVWGGYGGRVYSTAMATMCLEVYYRYLPLYERFEP